MQRPDPNQKPFVSISARTSGQKTGQGHAPTHQHTHIKAIKEYTEQLDVKYDIKNSNHERRRVTMQDFLNAFDIKISATSNNQTAN